MNMLNYLLLHPNASQIHKAKESNLPLPPPFTPTYSFLINASNSGPTAFALFFGHLFCPPW